MLSLAGQLTTAGVLAVLLGLAHLVLPSVLGWPAGLAGVTPMSKVVIGLHTGFVGLTCVLLGVLLLPVDALLSGGPLARTVLAVQTCFWGIRWVCELCVVRRILGAMSTPWRLAHLLGLVGWAWMAAVAGAALVWVCH